jgi:hypothetical protein
MTLLEDLSKLPQPGDVVMSESFASGYYGLQKKFVNIDGATDEKKRMNTIDAYDESRVAAKFVVEEAAVGSLFVIRGKFKYNIYTDGWNVKARRLDAEGKYDPKGELIIFRLGDYCNDMVNPDKVQIVGKMQLMYV